MTTAIEPSSASVVICSYTEDRWDLLMKVLDSVAAQTLVPQQVILVVDHNVDLYKRRALPAIEFALSRTLPHFSAIPSDTGPYPAGGMDGTNCFVLFGAAKIASSNGRPTFRTSTSNAATT